MSQFSKRKSELDINSLLQDGWSQYCPGQIFKENGIVHIAVCLTGGTSQTILALPSDFLPATKDIFFIPITGVNENSEEFYGSISKEGLLQCSPPLLGKLIFINVSYKVD